MNKFWNKINKTNNEIKHETNHRIQKKKKRSKIRK